MNSDKILAVAGEGLSQKCRERLSELGFEVVILPPYGRLGRGVREHADLMLFPIDRNIFIYRELTETLPLLVSKLRQRGYEITEVDMIPEEKYPRDIALNCLKVGKYIFCKQKNASAEILRYAEAGGYEVVNVNQGYARCTACPVGEGGIISADPSILTAAKCVGLKTLPITVGGVELEGFDHGFIGGACGLFDNTLYFAGELSAHPDGELIKSFCAELGVDTVFLSQESLTDVGSIFFFDRSR